MKPLLIIFICLCLLSVVPHAVFAQANVDNTQVINDAVKQNFVPLVGIPYVNTTGAPASFSNYVNGFYFAAISIAAFLAVVKIIFAGVKYMLTDVIPTKGKAKTEIRTSLLGLLIVISAVLILKTINPNLTNISLFSTAPMPVVGMQVASTTAATLASQCHAGTAYTVSADGSQTCVTAIPVPGGGDFRNNPGEGNVACGNNLVYNAKTNKCDVIQNIHPIPSQVLTKLQLNSDGTTAGYNADASAWCASAWPGTVFNANAKSPSCAPSK